jgi:hypothetical protein
MFNSNAIVVCNAFTTGNPDKNGNMPVILVPLAGKVPNRNVISGTSAEVLGFEVGKRYFVAFNETEPSEEYGRQFRIVNGGEVTAVEAIAAVSSLGSGQVVNVTVTEKVGAGVEFGG